MINFKNILSFFKKENNLDYNVNFASPQKRFYAFLIDYFIIYSLITLFIFIIIKKDIISNIDIKNETESSFEIDANNNISNVKNIDVIIDKDSNEQIIKPLSKEERIENLNTLIINKVYSDKLCRYIIILTPLLYNIIYLFTKKRATLGQQIFNLIVIKQDGSEMNVGDIFNRVFLYSLCKILFLIPFTIIIPVFMNKNKFTLYDYFTNTCVIEIR